MGTRPDLCGRFRARSIAWLAVCAIWSATAAGQDVENKALARQLFQQAVVAADHEDWVAAEDGFRRSLALTGSSVVRYNLASALSKRGKLVEASELLAEVEHDAGAESALREAGTALREAIIPRLAHLTLHVIGERKGVTLQLDGHPLPFEAVDVALPVDPGTHDVHAQRAPSSDAAGDLAFAVGEGEQQELMLELAPAPKPASKPAASAVAPTAAETARQGLSGVEHATPRVTSPAASGGKSVFASPWLWAATGLVAAAAVVAVVVVSSGTSDHAPVRGNLGSGLVVVGK
ncbi:MAG TPA: hypothetical protein VF331_22655 [Polyangiales bacterium]